MAKKHKEKYSNWLENREIKFLNEVIFFFLAKWLKRAVIPVFGEGVA